MISRDSLQCVVLVTSHRLLFVSLFVAQVFTPTFLQSLRARGIQIGLPVVSIVTVIIKGYSGYPFDVEIIEQGTQFLKSNKDVYVDIDGSRLSSILDVQRSVPLTLHHLLI